MVKKITEKTNLKNLDASTIDGLDLKTLSSMSQAQLLDIINIYKKRCKKAEEMNIALRNTFSTLSAVENIYRGCRDKINESIIYMKIISDAANTYKGEAQLYIQYLNGLLEDIAKMEKSFPK